jgi:hypothetical protein
LLLFQIICHNIRIAPKGGMLMDPKKSLEGFRVDMKQPKKKGRPIPKQTYKKGNAILIILFASLIGLTSGIGSAFAFGIKELPPSSSPLDEPSAKSVDQVEPSMKQSEIKTSELSPQKPPIDEPTVETAPIDEPITEEEKVKDLPVIKHEETPSESSEKSKDDKKNDKQEKAVKNNSSTEHKSESTKSKSTSEHKQKSTTPDLADQQTTTTPSTKTVSSKGEPKTTVPSGNVQTEKQTVQNKSISGTLSEASDSHTQTNSKSIPADQVAVSSEEIPDPKTKQGTLPDTAGNDLNHAVASFVIVCFSIAYLLSRKETHPQK